MKVYRYAVPCDGQWHDLELTGPIVKVDTRHEHAVEVWAIVRDAVGPTPRRFRVYGTGHDIPNTNQHVGSTVSVSGTFVWHLFEGCADDTNGDGDCGRIICPFCAPLGSKR